MAQEDSKADRKQRIEAYRKAVDAFDVCVSSSYPPGLLDFRPELEDAWTIREHLIHACDADIHGFTRYRFAIAEPGVTILAWEEAQWHEALSYEHQALTTSLQVIKLLRSIAAASLLSLSDEQWAAAWFIHPERGRMNLDDWLKTYTNHVAIHLDYIARNEKLWKEAGKASN